MLSHDECIIAVDLRYDISKYNTSLWNLICITITQYSLALITHSSSKWLVFYYPWWYFFLALPHKLKCKMIILHIRICGCTWNCLCTFSIPKAWTKIKWEYTSYCRTLFHTFFYLFANISVYLALIKLLHKRKQFAIVGFI